MAQMARILIPSILALTGCAASLAAQSNIGNARIQQRPAANLAATVTLLATEPGPAWIAYAVAAQRPESNTCCGDRPHRCCGGCRLESEARSAGKDASEASASTSAPVRLEGHPEVTILLRVSNGAIERVRAFSSSCELDAGGLPVYWLTGVPMPASVALLESLAEAPDTARASRSASEGALLAISMHRDPSADQALGRLMQPGRAERIRKQAAFWAAQTRGKTGLEQVRSAMAQAAPDDEFRRHAVFALSQSAEPEAAPALIALARDDRNSRVRGEALFWLAQKAGARAASAITEAIAHDPDTRVKERAVFALSQLPNDEGVPRLIDVARTNRNPAVRRQAMFWLGQSRDPRALKFFEEVLK